MGVSSVAVSVVTTAGCTTDCAAKYRRQHWSVASKTRAGAKAIRHLEAAAAIVASCVTGARKVTVITCATDEHSPVSYAGAWQATEGARWSTLLYCHPELAASRHDWVTTRH
jgi:hypothetical protein